jgi:membrane-bound serine protease (ClpP class)
MRLASSSSLLLALAAFASPVSAETSRVPVVELRDSINVGVSETLIRAVKEAKDAGAPALIVELDTPGGFLEATRDIVQLFLATDSPKILVWVRPEGARAASAGAMITMAAHYAAMAPSTSIGAATPVSGDGKDIGESMKAKITNDTLSFVEGIAEKRGRNVEWARKSVSDAASVSSKEALRQKVIDGVHSERSELWKGARAKFSELPESVEFVPFELSWRERTLSFVSNPNIAYGLLALGALGIYVEMTHPGLIIPGAIGAVSLALGAITMKIIPIRPGALALLVVGLVLLAIEVLTALPTYGVAGLLGAGALFLSGLFLMDSTETNLTLDPGLWIPIFLACVAIMGFLGWASFRAIRSKTRDPGLHSLDGLEGEITKVVTQSRAKIRVRGEIWDAEWHGRVSDGLPHGPAFAVGLVVTVVELKGMVALVKPKE